MAYGLRQQVSLLPVFRPLGRKTGKDGTYRSAEGQKTPTV
jgi:hypothetical protein